MASNELTKFHRACQNIVDNASAPALNWAVEYAKYGLFIDDIIEARIQALYILNNITHWRGDLAKETRVILKRLSDFTRSTE